MSTSDQSHSAENFTAIFNAASTEYQRVTRKRLDSHPLAGQLNTCRDPEAISNLLRMQAEKFSRFRKRDEKLMAWLDPTIHILWMFSATLGEGIGLPFSPAKTIFTGIGVLLGAVKDEAASYDTLIHLFERINSFLQRLNRYTRMPLTNEMSELLGKIMAQLLSVLAISMNVMTGSRIKRILKRLVGRRKVEDALLELDSLTKEESLMMVARNLEVTHRVDNIVHNVDGNVKETKVLTEVIDSNVRATKSLTKHIDGNVKATKELICDLDDNVEKTKVLTAVIDCNVKAAKTLTESIGHNVRAIDKDLKATKHQTHDLKRNQLRREFRTWLLPPDPSINHNTACEIQHPGTAKWFIQGSTFRDWKKNGSLLWIRGNPGAGKSVLCSAIIEDIKSMQEATGALIAYYYFDFKDASKRDVRGLLASLLFQLCDNSDSCWVVLYELYTSCRDGSEEPSNAALAECIKTILELPGQVPVFFILDALDECPSSTGTPSPREKVLDLVGKLVGSNHSNLFMCITSRPEQDIQTALNPLTSLSCQVSLHEEGGQRNDIKNYVHSFIHEDRAIRRWRQEDRQLIFNMLTERAGGMFRWVFCQLDSLRRCLPSSIRKALNDLPTTLDETYERVLQEIPKEKRQYAHRLFQCMVAAVRPLRVEELAEVFTIEFDPDAAPNLMEDWRPENPEEAVLSTCSTLITVINNKGSRIIQFSHFSVKEFLTSDRLLVSEAVNLRQYHIPLHAAHEILARACLVVLLQLDKNVDKMRLGTFPLAFYAAKHWVDHAKFEGVALRVHGLMERLFDPNAPYLAAWTWIHNADQVFVREFDHTSPERPSPPRATALYYAALCGFGTLARHLITRHAEDVNSKCGYFGAPLHAVSKEGHLDTARVLLEYNADVNLRGRSNWVPLHFASDVGHAKVAQILLEHQAHANAKNDENWTPLRCATNHGHLDVIKSLVGHGADIDARDNIRWTSLHQASNAGQLEVARFLLEHGAFVDARDCMNWTPLDYASSAGHVKSVKLLAEYGADIVARGRADWMPLHAASYAGHLEVVRFLVEHGANVNARDNENWTPLSSALCHGHIEVAEFLLERRAEVDVRGNSNWTLLHQTSYYGYLGAVKFLVKRGFDVNARDDMNRTPLHSASVRGHLQVVKFLVNLGVDIDSRDGMDGTPLSSALYHGQFELAKFLVERGADINSRDNRNRTPLHRASYLGHLEVVKYLVRRRADISARDDMGWTPLHRASDHGCLSVTEFLIKCGADVNAMDNQNRTPLHRVSMKRDLAVVKVLLEAAADVDARDDQNWTPLLQASYHGHLEIVKTLVEHGANVNAADDRNWTSLHQASCHGHLGVVKSLVEHGADVDAIDDRNWTSLHQASYHGHLEVVKYLVRRRADINARDDINWTPLHQASCHGHLDIVKYLLKYSTGIIARDDKYWAPCTWGVRSWRFGGRPVPPRTRG